MGRFVALMVLMLLPGVVLAKDVAGARDHPLVGRYQGSEISFYAASEFDAADGAWAEPEDDSDEAEEPGDPAANEE